MSRSTTAPQANGHGTVPPETQRKVEFYEKTLRIRDEVLAGKHPRIALPPHVREQYLAILHRSTKPTPSLPIKPVGNGVPAPQAHPGNAHPPSPSSNGYKPHAQNTSRPFSNTAKLSTGIDPVLLTKSDHLIRAELQLKRQQIERVLKEQSAVRNRDKDNTFEEAPFDAEELQAKAHELVKPLSGLQVSLYVSDENESFDENSYYSSQANSWSEEEVDSNRNPISVDAPEPLTMQANQSAAPAPLTVGEVSSRPDALSREDHAMVDIDDEPYEPTEDIEVFEPEPAAPHEIEDEDDYSPPPADIIPNESNGRNRAVQPRSFSRRQSPAGNPQPIQSRKRRREERPNKRRQQVSKRVERAPGSPAPVIKEEPQSPPPLADFADAQPKKRRALQPLAPPGSWTSGRAQPIFRGESEHLARAPPQYEEPASPMARVPRRPLERDDQELRRVASLQYARRPYSPGEGAPFYQVPEPRGMRAASHAFVERPVEQRVYREVSALPAPRTRYVQERSISPGREYFTRPPSPVSMGPPPRRIVVDRFGNKYYATPAKETEPMPSRAISIEPYYPPGAEVYEDGDAQRMPPPPARRMMETDIGVEPRASRSRAASYRPVEVDHQGRELVERRPAMQYEQMPPRGSYMAPRAYSVRPEVVRREGPGEYIAARHESVQPGYVRVAAPRYREISVLPADAYDDRRYTYAPDSRVRRYVEGDREMPIEVTNGTYSGEARRVSYR